MRQENDYGPHTSQHTVNQHGLYRSVGHVLSDAFLQPGHTGFYPVLRIGTNVKGGGKHNDEHHYKYGKAHIFVRQDGIKIMCPFIGIGVVACSVLSLFQRSVYETVLRIHDGGFRIFVGFLLYPSGSVVPMHHNLLGIRKGTDHVFNLLVVL